MASKDHHHHHPLIFSFDLSHYWLPVQALLPCQGTLRGREEGEREREREREGEGEGEGGGRGEGEGEGEGGRW